MILEDKQKRFLFYEYAFNSVILEGGTGDFWVNLAGDEKAEDIAKEFQQWLKDEYGEVWSCLPGYPQEGYYWVGRDMEGIGFRNVPLKLGEISYPTLTTLWL